MSDIADYHTPDAIEARRRQIETVVKNSFSWRAEEFKIAFQAAPATEADGYRHLYGIVRNCVVQAEVTAKQNVVKGTLYPQLNREKMHQRLNRELIESGVSAEMAALLANDFINPQTQKIKKDPKFAVYAKAATEFVSANLPQADLSPEETISARMKLRVLTRTHLEQAGAHEYVAAAVAQQVIDTHYYPKVTAFEQSQLTRG